MSALLPVLHADSETRLKTARAHAALFPSDPSLQRDRLVLEFALSSHAEACSIGDEILKLITRPGLPATDQKIVEEVWLLLLEKQSRPKPDPQLTGLNISTQDAAHQNYLRESLRQSAIPGLHSKLLRKIFLWWVAKDILLSVRDKNPTERIGDVGVLRQVIASYQPDHDFFSWAFEDITGRVRNVRLRSAKDTSISVPTVEDDMQKMEEVYRLWRTNISDPYDKIEACLMYSRWCLDDSFGRKAMDAVDVLSRELAGRDEAAKNQLGTRWMALLQDVERAEAERLEQAESHERLRLKAEKDTLQGEEIEVDSNSDSNSGSTSESESESEDEETSDGSVAAEEDGDVFMV